MLCILFDDDDDDDDYDDDDDSNYGNDPHDSDKTWLEIAVKSRTYHYQQKLCQHIDSTHHIITVFCW